MRESSSESDHVELESNYSSSENDDDIKGCYMNEPEYLEKEINTMNILENENFSDNSEESDLDSSRLENLHWCSGFECGISLTIIFGVISFSSSRNNFFKKSHETVLLHFFDMHRRFVYKLLL